MRLGCCLGCSVSMQSYVILTPHMEREGWSSGRAVAASILFLRFYLFLARNIKSFSCLPRPATLACALTGNQTGDLSVRRPVLNPLSHTSQGPPSILNAANLPPLQCLYLEAPPASLPLPHLIPHCGIKLHFHPLKCCLCLHPICSPYPAGAGAKGSSRGDELGPCISDQGSREAPYTTGKGLRGLQ